MTVVEAVIAARKLVTEWEKHSLDAELWALVRAVRTVVVQQPDPIVIALVTHDMQRATGLSTRALRLTEP